MSYALISVCALIFVTLNVLRDYEQGIVVLSFGMIPAILFEKAQLANELIHVPAKLTLVTHLFLHLKWPHIIMNSLFLWLFGSLVEGSLGRLRFLGFFLVCGTFSGLAQALLKPSSQIPLIGASGAIFGILGASILLYAHRRLLTGVLLLFFFIQFVNSVTQPPEIKGVAWMAHLSGFVAGMLFLPLFSGRLKR